MKPSRYQWHRPLILAVCVLLAACSTVLPPEAGDDGGPKPIDLRKHMMEILEPDSLFRMRWASQIGDITDETLLVTSEVNKAQVYNSGGFQVRTLLEILCVIGQSTLQEGRKGSSRNTDSLCSQWRGIFWFK